LGKAASISYENELITDPAIMAHFAGAMLGLLVALILALLFLRSNYGMPCPMVRNDLPI
jgi:hypothetical protein